jgi:anti-anti-sigma factor
MDLKIKHRGNHVRFQISGIIDNQGAELLEKRFMQLNLSELKEFDLDFDQVQYICSLGVKKLLFFYRKITTNGGRFQIKNDSGIFHELLTITNMKTVINCYGN